MSSNSNILSVPTANSSPNNSVVIHSHQDSQNITLNQSADHPTSSNLDNLNINDKFQDDHEIKLLEAENQGVNDSISSKKLNDGVGEFSDVDISVDNEEEVREGENNNKDLNEKELRQKRIR